MNKKKKKLARGSYISTSMHIYQSILFDMYIGIVTPNFDIHNNQDI